MAKPNKMDKFRSMLDEAYAPLEEPPAPEVQTVCTLDVQTVRPSERLTVEPSEAQTVKPSDGQTVIDSESQRLRPTETQTVRDPDRQTVRDSDGPTDIPYYSVPAAVRTIPEIQSLVLEALLSIHSHMTSYSDLGAQLGLSTGSVRKALTGLVAKGFIGGISTVRSQHFQGFSYVVNVQLCDMFMRLGGSDLTASAGPQIEAPMVRPSVPLTVRPFVHQTDRPSETQAVRPFDGQTLHSSSLDYKEPTTTMGVRTVRPSAPPTDRPPEELFVLAGGEMAFWREEGLQERQTLKWCEEFSVKPDEMRRMLKWARFDLVNNQKSAEVKSVINWFYGVLARTAGCYSRPSNYLTPTEIRLQQMQEELQRELDAQQQLLQTERELQFRAILADPSSREYQELLAQVSPFEAESSPFIREKALRIAFDKL